MKYYDSTESTAGGRIPVQTNFETEWDEDFNLLSYKRDGRIEKEFDRMDKLAISRHKKKLMLKLGLIEEEPLNKMIVMQFHPVAFYIEYGKITEKQFITSFRRYDLNNCVAWSQEKEELIKQYRRVKEETESKLNEIKEKIMETKPNQKQGRRRFNIDSKWCPSCSTMGAILLSHKRCKNCKGKGYMNLNE